jgi:uncharacterized coiled-coil protein SlyX
MSDQFERRLDSIESKLDIVTNAISKIAVQKQRIDSLEFKINSLWLKWDKLTDPSEGVLSKIQAQIIVSGNQNKTIKWVMGLFGATVLGCTVSLFAMANYLMRLSNSIP